MGRMSTLAAAALRSARRHIERNVLLDTVTVTRPADGKGTLGGASGYEVIDPTPAVVYTGSGLISNTAGSRQTFDGETETVARRVRVRLPLECPAIEPGDLISLDVCSLDPALEGQTFTVVRMLTATGAASRFALAEIEEDEQLRGA